MRRRRGRPLRAALLIYTATAIAPNAGRGRLFLDSASVDAWRELLPTGLFYGVTTNPTILKRDGVPCTVPDVAKLARTALGAGCQEVMVQAWGGSVDAYEKCSLDLLDAVGAAGLAHVQPYYFRAFASMCFRTRPCHVIPAVPIT